MGRLAAVIAALTRLLLAAHIAAGCSCAQSTSDFLARLDRFSRTFKGAQATVVTTNHVVGVPEDDKETGAILIRQSAPGKVRIRIDFTGANAKSVVLREQVAEIYYPKMDQVQEYDIRNYRDIAQKLFLLGFGTPGRELANSYHIQGLRSETVDSQPTTHIELVPTTPDVLKQLKRVELWISDKTDCPVRQIFFFPDGGYRMAQFSDVRVKPAIPGSAFDLPKSAKRTRMN